MMQARGLMLMLGAAASLLALPNIGHTASAVPNFSIPGVPSPGFVHFENTANITLTRNTDGFSLTSVSTPGKFTFQYSPSTAFDVTGTFNLSASFTNKGVFTGGNVAITGTVPAYSVPGTAEPSPSPQNLFSANLDAYGADKTADATPVALGFRTDRDSFSGWAAQFASSADESVYLYSFNVPALVSFLGNPKFPVGWSTTYSGMAMTTVPVPAAVWLFGSAMGLVPWIRRRKTESH